MNKRFIQQGAALAMVLGFLGCGGVCDRAWGQDYVMQTFDLGITNWAGLTTLLTFDATQDNTGNGGGSCRAETDFAAVQCLTFEVSYGYLPWGPNPPLDLREYASVEFDIKWDNNSGMSLADFNNPPSGGTTTVAIESILPDLSKVFLASFSIPAGATSGWAHVTASIDPTAPGIDQSTGLWFSKWIAAGNGMANFWLDNVVLKQRPCCAAPPALRLENAMPGLNLFAGALYERENIRTSPALAGMGWYGAGVVNYSFTLSAWNDASTNGFQMHMFLVPSPGDESDADWLEPSVVTLDLQRPGGPGAPAVWSFRYKTNEPSNMGGPTYTNPPAQITNASALGTWTLTFSNNTTVFLTAPDGASAHCTLDDAASAALGSGDVRVYWGVQANSPAGSESSAVLSEVKIDGELIGTVIDDFAGGLDTNLWNIIAGNPANVWPVPPWACWLSWPLADAVYVLETNADLSQSSGWSTNGLPSAVQLGAGNRVLLTTNTAFTATPIAFPGCGSLFFRLQTQN